MAKHLNIQLQALAGAAPSLLGHKGYRVSKAFQALPERMALLALKAYRGFRVRLDQVDQALVQLVLQEQLVLLVQLVPQALLVPLDRRAFKGLLVPPEQLDQPVQLARLARRGLPEQTVLMELTERMALPAQQARRAFKAFPDQAQAQTAWTARPS